MIQKIEHNSLCETESYKGMTYNDIKKALEEYQFQNMPLIKGGKKRNVEITVSLLLEVYKRQQAEIEKKTTQCERLEIYMDELVKQKLNQAKTEAIKEFAERLKKISKEITIPYIADTTIQEMKTGMFWYEIEDFNNLVKEMTEVQE